MRKPYWLILVAVLVLIPVVWALLPSNPPPLEPNLLASVPSLVTETKEKLLLYRQDTLAACTEIDPGRGTSSKRPYIVIDTHTNRLYYRTQDSVLFSALCSTGTGAELVDSGGARKWRFSTPKGVFRVDSRVANPWWRKPDWAFIEEGEKPPQDEEERLDPNVLGDFALGFGNGYFIHGTIYERLIGVAVTHGCVRLYSQDIKRLYQVVKIGTPVIIY